jgi:hypothetical protein
LCLEIQFVIGNEFKELNFVQDNLSPYFETILTGILKRTIVIFKKCLALFGDFSWLTKLAYMVDILSHFNGLNLRLE